MRIVLLLTILALPAWAENFIKPPQPENKPEPVEVPFLSFETTISRVIDGDTMVIPSEIQGERRVKLYGIDAPEREQDGGLEAMNFTRNMVDGKKVHMTVYGLDDENRMVVNVMVDGRNLSEELVMTGNAWVFPWECQSQECDLWNALQQNAMNEHWGLWKGEVLSTGDVLPSNPTPPWEWRMRKMHPELFEMMEQAQQEARTEQENNDPIGNMSQEHKDLLDSKPLGLD